MTEKAPLNTEAFNSTLSKLSNLKIKGNIDLSQNFSVYRLATNLRFAYLNKDSRFDRLNLENKSKTGE